MEPDHGSPGLGAKSLEIAGQVRLVHDRAGVRIAAFHRPPQGAFLDIVVGAVVGVGDDVVVFAAADARDVAQHQVVPDFMFQRQRRRRRFRFLKVAVEQAIEVVPVDVHGNAVHGIIGMAVVGHIVRAQVVDIQHRAGAVPKLERQGRSEPDAVGRDLVAAGDLAVLDQGIQAHGRPVGHHVVGVRRGPFAERIAEGGRPGHGVFLERLLGHKVDAAARGAAPGVGRPRSLDDLDLFQVEHVAGLGSRIAQAVDIDIAFGGIAANVGQIAVGDPALAGAERDPRGGAEHILQAGRVPLLHQFLGNDGDRFRGVDQGRRELARRRAVDLVAGFRRSFDRDRRQLDRAGVAAPRVIRLRQRRSCDGTGNDGARRRTVPKPMVKRKVLPNRPLGTG